METPPLNQQIQSLTPFQINHLTKKLSSSDRSYLISVIKNPVEQKNDRNKKILEKISTIKTLSPALTEKTTRASIFRIFEKKIRQFAAKAASLFGFITAKRTAHLAMSILQKKGKSLEKDKDQRPTVSKPELKKILRNLKRSPKQSLSEALTAEGFSSEISHLSFNEENSFQGIDLKEIKFSNCKFNWCHFSEANLNQVVFEGCLFNNTSFQNAKLDHCQFHLCRLREVMLVNTGLENVQFLQSDLITCSFEDANLNSCEFTNVVMPATHFLSAEVTDSIIENSQLQNTVFFDTKERFSIDEESVNSSEITKPVGAILVFPEARGVSTPKAFMKIEKGAHSIPLRISAQSASVTKENVNKEVESCLAEIGEYDPSREPIPRQLLKKIKENRSENPSLEKIVKKAKLLASEVNAFLLPGGEDVPPALYGEEEGEKTEWGGDYRRSILELAMIEESFNQGIPLLAVCRGFQISNVYCGAQLEQHVEGQLGMQQFSPANDEQRGLFGEAIKKSIVSTVAHHQAVTLNKKAKDRLETAVLYKDMIKATEQKGGGSSPMFLLQFHPEFHRAPTADSLSKSLIDKYLNIRMSDSNELFWSYLSDASEAHRIKKMLNNQIKEKHPAKLKKVSKGKQGSVRLSLDELKVIYTAITELEKEAEKTYLHAQNIVKNLYKTLLKLPEQINISDQEKEINNLIEQLEPQLQNQNYSEDSLQKRLDELIVVLNHKELRSVIDRLPDKKKELDRMKDQVIHGRQVLDDIRSLRLEIQNSLGGPQSPSFREEEHR